MEGVLEVLKITVYAVVYLLIIKLLLFDDCTDK